MLRSPGRLLAGCVAIAASIAGLGGCGGSGDDGSSADAGLVRSQSTDFPATKHRSLRLLVADMQQGPELAPSVSIINTGRSRFGFGLFDEGRKQIGSLPVVLYYAKGPDEPAHGPYSATFEPIDIKPAFESETTSQDPDSARGIYISRPPFRRPGNYLVLAVTNLGGQLVASRPAQVKVSRSTNVPGPGDKAISVHTPTKQDVGGKLEEIDTRIPPSGMHEVDFADALADGKPAILLFSTPALCKSRVCAPVTDVAEQVRQDHGDKVDFIHQEVYRDNDPNKGLNSQLEAWHLPGEPFLFAIDAKGTVVERLEGAFSPRELESAVRKAQQQ